MKTLLIRELTWLVLAVVAGMFLLPMLIYILSGPVLGDYGENADLFTFYGEIRKALFRGEWTAWILVTSPWLALSGLRLIWQSLRRSKVSTINST